MEQQEKECPLGTLHHYSHIILLLEGHISQMFSTISPALFQSVT